jgi:hypothetical protein
MMIYQPSTHTVFSGPINDKESLKPQHPETLFLNIFLGGSVAEHQCGKVRQSWRAGSTND